MLIEGGKHYLLKYVREVFSLMIEKISLQDSKLVDFRLYKRHHQMPCEKNLNGYKNIKQRFTKLS